VFSACGDCPVLAPTFQNLFCGIGACFTISFATPRTFSVFHTRSNRRRTSWTPRARVFEMNTAKFAVCGGIGTLLFRFLARFDIYTKSWFRGYVRNTVGLHL
jgi:hypothetical protein